ncbi:MAG TPA: FeoA family protein [Burkholderiaceae bacterium]
MTQPEAIALTELANGQRGVIASVQAASDLVDAATVQRLHELGFLPGEPVRLMQRGPGGREPIAVQVGDTLFALRWVEARCIDVRTEADRV